MPKKERHNNRRK